ncbi:C2 family cysteine protease [Actinomadura sp. HBU206391]|uniref:C2 family cysteine protease n=1 Tax=Actinomadura sp. HBU206391 TaxID=2731692 RepID=UPI00164F7677|nr:C2 family cysteine protease [Actinomadura sp. HBU206391]MBC6459373.1 hypothetical protein [Actinomadura sp. HBU206391]
MSRLRLSGADRGEGAISHLGVVLLVAAVSGAVAVSGLPGVVTGGITGAVCRVSDPACDDGPASKPVADADGTAKDRPPGKVGGRAADDGCRWFEFFCTAGTRKGAPAKAGQPFARAASAAATPNTGLAVDEEKVDETVEKVRDALDDKISDVILPEQMQPIMVALSKLQGPDLDAAIAALSDDELKEIFASRTGYSGTVNMDAADIRDKLTEILRNNASPDTLRRLAEHDSSLNPDDPGSFDTTKIKNAADQLHEVAEDIKGDLFVTARDMNGIHRAIDGLSSRERDAVLGRLSDADLKKIFGTTAAGEVEPDRRKITDSLMRTAPLDLIRRIAKYDSTIEPSLPDDSEGIKLKPVKGGVPFINGNLYPVEPSDVSQGRLGDCYFIASLGALALKRPDIIQKAIRENANGTYTVTLFPGNVRTEVTVTPDLPTDENGNPAFAGTGDIDSNREEIWPGLMEKAYAKIKGGYGDIEGGKFTDRFGVLTGKSREVRSPVFLSIHTATWNKPIDFDELATEFNSGNPITAGVVNPIAQQLIGNVGPPTDYVKNGEITTDHEYFLTEVNEQDKTVTVQNPWGSSYPEVTMSWKDFSDTFINISIGSVAAK